MAESFETRKYVILSVEGNLFAVVFQPALFHDTFKDLSPVSAGFFTLTPTEKGIRVRVESVGSHSLGMGPRVGDEELIRQALGLPKSEEL